MSIKGFNFYPSVPGNILQYWYWQVLFLVTVRRKQLLPVHHCHHSLFTVKASFLETAKLSFGDAICTIHKNFVVLSVVLCLAFNSFKENEVLCWYTYSSVTMLTHSHHHCHKENCLWIYCIPMVVFFAFVRIGLFSYPRF